MKKIILVVWILCLTIFGTFENTWAQPILVGWDYGPYGGLVRIDIETGAYNTILSAPHLQIEALAFDSYNGVLYGVVNGESSLLVNIDWGRGVISDIGIIPNFSEITAMTYDETTKTIFVLDQTTRTLLSIDPATALPTVIGHFSFGSSNALAADPITGQLYGSLMGLFGSIDKSTGSFTTIGDTGVNVITGLEFLPKSQTLYGVGGITNAGAQLFILDLNTGQPTFIGSPNLPQITTLGFVEQRVIVNPYQNEYVIMVGNAYDWPARDDTSSGKLFYIPINPGGTFGNVSYITDLGYRAGAGIADFDNDGDLDFVAGAIVERGPERALANFYLFENVGDGSFVQHLIASNVDAGATSDNRVGTFAVADFNEDGYKDFVVPICKSDHVYLFTNNGNKTFTLTTLTPLNDPSDAKEGDFNEDGHMDFVVTDYFNRKVYLYKGNGSGAFTVQPLIDVAGGHRATDITAGDFDGDGHLDIIVDDFIPHGGGTHLYTGKIENGNLDFVYQGVVFSRPLLVDGTSYDNVYGVDSFDFDKDGHRDLILSTYEYPPAGLVFIMRGKGDGTFWPAEQILTPPIGALGSVFPVTPSEIARDVTPPVLSLPNDVTEECAGPQGKVVIFDATAIDDIDGKVPVNCTPPSGSIFPLGITTVTCSASDKAKNTARGTFNIIVNDTTTPNITNLTASQNVLWPPNHKMVTVSLVTQVSDTCDPNPICETVSINSNEPENGLGDGDTSPDWEITGKLKVNLRAERSGNGSGRVYTITVKCSDTSGNSSLGTATVSVPHDQGEKKGKK